MSAIPQVSVLFTTYNDSRFVAQAIESVLNQTFADFEVIVADDASTDNTIDVVSQYKDPRIRIVRNDKNLGLARNLNAALPRCRADLVARQDGDDASFPTRFDKQVRYLREHAEVAVLGTQDIWIDENGHETDRYWFPTDHDDIVACLRERNCFNHSSVVFRKSVIESLGAYRPFPGCEDYELWARVAARHRVANLPERLVLRRIRRGSMSWEGLGTQTASFRVISRLAKQRFDTGRDELDELHGAQLEQRIAILLKRELKASRKVRASGNVEIFHRVLQSSGKWAAFPYCVRAMRLDPWNPYIIRLFLDHYVSPRIYRLWKGIKGGASTRSGDG